MDLFLFYLICFGVGLLFTLVSALFAHVFDAGADAHGHPDAGHADGHAGCGGDMPGFSLLNPTTIASFVTAFGGFGMILSKFDATRHPLISAPLSALGGCVVAGLVFLLFRAIFKATQSSSESRVDQLIGVSGTIITPIPPGGVGEIAYVHSGSRYTAPARTEDGRAVGSGSTVYIVRITGTQFYVTPT